MSQAAMPGKSGLRQALRLVALGVVFLNLFGTANAQASPPPRRGWFLDLGLGAGKSRDYGAGVTLRIGYALGPRLALGLESNTLRELGGLGDLNTSAEGRTLGSGALALYTSPWERGLLLNAGVGMGSVDFNGDSGPAFVLGGQYEFPAGRSMTWGPTIDFVWMRTAPPADYYVAGLGANWYFLQNE